MKSSTNSTGTTFSHASQIAKPPFPHVPPNCHGREEVRGIIMPLPRTNTLFPPHHHAPNEPEHLNNTHHKLKTTMTILLSRLAPHPCNLHRLINSNRPPSSSSSAQVGQSLYDSLKILGLRLGASKREVKLAYRRLACLYHPDK